MDRSGNSVWHAGGTRAPLLMKRAGPAAGIRHPRATGVVPLRATGGRFEDAKDPARRIFHPSDAPSGTEWHGRPRESTQGHRRAR
jgi:hypothetical protein